MLSGLNLEIMAAKTQDCKWQAADGESMPFVAIHTG